MSPPSNGIKIIQTNLKIKIEQPVYKKLSVLATIRGKYKRDLVSEAIREYVLKYEDEIPEGLR